MFLYFGWKPEYSDKTHADTGRTCKLHRETSWPRIEPRTFVLWGDSANHCCATYTQLDCKKLFGVVSSTPDATNQRLHLLYKQMIISFPMYGITVGWLGGPISTSGYSGVCDATPHSLSFQLHSARCDDLHLGLGGLLIIMMVLLFAVADTNGTTAITRQCSWLATGSHTLLPLILFGSLQLCVSKLHSTSLLLCLFKEFTSHPWGFWGFPLCGIVHVPRHTIFYRCSHWEVMLFQLGPWQIPGSNDTPYSDVVNAANNGNDPITIGKYVAMLYLPTRGAAII